MMRPQQGPSSPQKYPVAAGDRPEAGAFGEGTLAALMQEIARIASQFLEVEEAIQGVLAQVRGGLGIEQMVVYVTDSETGDLILQVGEGPSETPRPPTGARREEAKPNLSLPLRAADATLGMLKVWSPPHGISTQGEQLLRFAALQLAVAAERWQLRQRLRETTQVLEERDHFEPGVSDGLTDGLVTTDTLGTVTFANRAAEELVGRPRRSLTGRPLGEAVPSSEDWLVWLATDSLITGRASPPREVNLLRPDGTSLPVEARVSVLRGDGGATRGVVLILKDLREQKALQQEKSRLDRLAVMGEMSAVVAHEFRSPLAGIKLGVQYLSQHVRPEDPLGHSVSIIADEVEQMDRKVEDILLISRRFELQLRPCDPKELVERAVSKLAGDLQTSRIRVHREFADRVPLIMADAMRMEQVLTNLIQNAIDAMPEGGDLILSVACQRRGAAEGEAQATAGSSLSWGSPTAATEVTIRVRDTGEGIPLVALDRIFEPFYTTKSKGTGLGLAIVDRIVREHGGQVKAANAPDRGAEFTITLPASLQESSPWQRLSS